MADKPRQRAWTAEEARREEAAQQARVRRDAARGPAENLKESFAHTAFARRFAEAFRHSRGA